MSTVPFGMSLSGACGLRMPYAASTSQTAGRSLTKDGDDSAIIYVDQALMSVLKVQRERQEMWKEKVGAVWDDHDPIFARDGYMPRKDGITPCRM
ncbi:hypothetical protein ACFWP3_06075 [Streptomyces sp. NPDC058525]|uniref:hypothetical protein n=1 Tax=Streptomyces sp. NPDC058525 TaxID=3346538 RepID=UPI00364726F2